MAPYSMDLRTRVVADWDAGVPAKELAAKFRVSRSWVNRLVQRRRETGRVSPRPQTVFKRQAFAGQEDRLRALVAAQPDQTLAELRDALHSAASLNNAAPTSPLSDATGANGSRSATCGSTSFSMSAA